MAARVEVEGLEDAQDVLSLDETTLDPELHYRFCHPRNLARRRAQGYEPVLRDSGVRLLNDFDDKETPDGLIRVGNLMLMACPKERFKARRRQVEELTRSRLKSSEQSFEAKARKRGVESITEEKRRGR